MENKKDNLVIGCRHILEAGKVNKKIRVFEVLEDTFTCVRCAVKMPKTKKEFMDMFVTLCRDCVERISKNKFRRKYGK